MPGAIDARNGLFDQVDAVVAQHLASANGPGFVPRLIHVHPHAGAVAQRVLDGDHVLEVLFHRIGANLELENPVTAQVEHVLRFSDIASCVATGQGPGHLKAVAHAPAQ